MKRQKQLANFLIKSVKKSHITLMGVTLGTLGLLHSMTPSAIAENYFGNNNIQFDQDTIIEFEFIESHGAYQSTFGVLDIDSCQTQPGGEIILSSCDKTALLVEAKASDAHDTVARSSTYEDSLVNQSRETDFVGTPGNTVPRPMSEFKFEAGKRYAFYLESSFNGGFAGIVYSSTDLNSQGNVQAIFEEGSVATAQLVSRQNVPDSNVNQYEALINGGVLIRFDDTGSQLVKTDYQDVDFDDFVVGIGGYQVDCN
ncbi:hypothetical protein Xen7305DRAFT_00015580 [Xenococcus sp. PCC 7305]|uniref:hypothetical protein n=1 Tax=Xenococcus sp. PCC 7305 TaxID=102125 RepID=UPI0002ACAE94|nr:hypothetical protein [Xenococcus sp. PCC 7305]ELS01851.1 hypothetical protein Xen7305DRAFT_00015580 [Xenococcus sp. PCC 7305]